MVGALAIGVSYDLFWHLTPKKLESFYKADEIKRKRRDEEAWFQGMYFASAIDSTICNAFRDGQKEKYANKPFLQDLGISEEEKIEKELQNMLLAEEMWIKQAKQKGLPQTQLL